MENLLRCRIRDCDVGIRHVIPRCQPRGHSASRMRSNVEPCLSFSKIHADRYGGQISDGEMNRIRYKEGLVRNGKVPAPAERHILHGTGLDLWNTNRLINSWHRMGDCHCRNWKIGCAKRIREAKTKSTATSRKAYCLPNRCIFEDTSCTVLLLISTKGI